MSQTQAQLVDYGTAVASSVPTNGPYLSAANTVAISTNGTGRLFVNSSGSVGIGTSSPGNILHVTPANSSGASATDGVRVSAGTSSVGINFGANSSGTFGWIQSSNAGVAFAPTVINPQGGNVGIGTTAPAVPLEVVNTIRASRSGSPGTYIELFGGSSSADPYINVPTGFGIPFLVNNTERARIDSSGRLLVGTSSSRTIGLPTAYPSLFQIETTNYAAFSLVNNSGDVQPAYLTFGKSRGGIGSNTIVQSGDVIGHIGFAGADGTDVETLAAHIQCAVDGTPGANDMPGRLVFSTTADGASSPTERMRITQAGDLLYGVTSFSNATKGFLLAGSSGRAYITCAGDTVLDLNRLTSTGEVVAFRTSGTQVGSITVTGSATAYNTSSDYRLKENVEPVADGITRLQQLKPSRFNFIADPDRTVDGFIAHEVQEVVPEAITGEKDAVNDDGNPVYQGIDQSKLVPLLTAALQEAVAKIETLEARLTALESA